jgi:hypothetical protein
MHASRKTTHDRQKHCTLREKRPNDRVFEPAMAQISEAIVKFSRRGIVLIDLR